MFRRFRRKKDRRGREPSSGIAAAEHTADVNSWSHPERRGGGTTGGATTATVAGTPTKKTALGNATGKNNNNGNWQAQHGAVANPLLIQHKKDSTKNGGAGARNKSGEQPSSPRASRSSQQAESHWLFRSRRFQKMCDAVFDAIDTDGSGSVDEKELYAGLLLIHLKLGMYAGPAACRPLGRERCHAVFVDMDADGSGQLDREEFRRVMICLVSNVLLRVVVQWSMTLLIVPLVAQSILDGMVWTVEQVYFVITNLDETWWVADRVEVWLEDAWTVLVEHTPAPAGSTATVVQSYLAKVPEGVWNSIPLTLLSTVLGVLVVPLIIWRIDEFFTRAAKKAAEKKKAAEPVATEKKMA